MVHSASQNTHREAEGVAVAAPLSWQEMSLLTDLIEQQRSDAGLDGYGKRAMRSLSARGLVLPETYANGRFWRLSEAGTVAAAGLVANDRP